MRRLALITGLLALVAGAFVATGAGDSGERYRVRAIFDNASFVVPGEDVKVAGVRVGKIDDVGVTRDHKAIVVLDITDPAFQDFRRDAECTVRPASLIGEEFVECVPTQKRAPGRPLPPPLAEIADGPGKGQRLLPVTNTSAAVDLDLINNTLQRPYRERLALILGELGVGVAGRGEDLNQLIRKANPALREVQGVLRLLARQNAELEQLAVDSDRIMAPLARERRSVSGFVENAGDVAAATAERRAALEANLQRFPGFLRELRPTMGRLEELADEMTPVVGDLGAQAPAINRLIRQLGPFARAGTPALQSLGDIAEPGVPALRGSRPIVADLRRLGRGLRPVARAAGGILASFDKNKGSEYLMDYIYTQALAVNGFDSIGHYLRAALIVNVCSQYSIQPVSGCSANFQTNAEASAAAARAQSMGGDQVLKDTAAILAGADPKDVLSADERRRRQAQADRMIDDLKQEATTKARARARAQTTPPTPTPPAETGEAALMDFLFGSDQR